MGLFNKKGDLSLNVIIVAALALIVLVLLVMIFTGRIGIFKAGVEKAGELELAKQKLNYGVCHPTPAKESSFIDTLSKATSESSKTTEISTFSSEISRCKTYNTDKTSCEGAGCTWQ